MLIHSSPYNFKSRWAGEAYSHLAPLTASHIGRRKEALSRYKTWDLILEGEGDYVNDSNMIDLHDMGSPISKHDGLMPLVYSNVRAIMCRQLTLQVTVEHSRHRHDM